MDNTTSIGEDAFQAASTRFIEWFLSDPDATINPKVSLVDLRGEGCGRGLGMVYIHLFSSHKIQV